MKRLLLAVAAIVALAAGCGGVESEPNLAKAVERTEAVGTLRFEVTAREDASGRSFEVACSGSADYERNRMRIDCDWAGRDRVSIIAIGDEFYTRGPTIGNVAGDRWVRESFDSNDSTVQETFAPEDILALLRNASRKTERIGEEDVRGISTVRYRLTVDCGEAELICDGTAPVEVWIDEDGLVRRIVVHDEDPVTFEFFDFGADVQIEPPPADEVVDEQELDDSGSDVGQCEDAAKPISVEEAARSLRKHGFTADSERSGCIASVAAWLTNFAAAGSNDEPFLSCFVFSNPQTSADVGVGLLVGEGDVDEPVERRLENLQCALHVRRETDEAVARLDAALAELKRSIRS